MKDYLVWNEENRRTVFTCPIFSVGERVCRSPDKQQKTFTVLDASDWAIVIPVLETKRGREFVMVWQWRHGARELSLEFPGEQNSAYIRVLPLFPRPFSSKRRGVNQ